ncbi:MAG: hypothetical protein GF310_05395 [candidate division Zixibacteria bacterium]|nr:hypothetical protein [candidate division Zixibacteria bacterium]
MSNSISSYRRGLPQEYGPQRTIYRIILCLVLAFAILIPARLAAEYKTEFADTVVLSSGDLPYNVPQSNLLILTSGNLHASGTAINVGDRNDIMIDGGGDTIFFGSGEGDFVHGVRMSYSPERIQIKNLTLIHDVPDATLAEDCSPIHLYGDDSVWVKNVNMVSRGVEGNCIDATTKYGNGISNLWVEDCECDNRAHSYYSRNADPAAAFRVCADISTLGAGEYTGKFENVTVTRTPHSAIYAVGGSDNRPVMIIHDCSLTVDAHNDMYDTTNATVFHSSGDPFAISVFRLGAGSQIYNNVIRSGEQYEGGQGMMIQGAQGTASNPVEIYNNDVQVHCGPTQSDLRYGGDGKSIGFYLRWPEGDSKMSNCYVKIRDNIFKTYADALTDLDNGGTAHTGGSAQGIRIHADSGFHNCELVNNRVFAMRSDSLVDTGYVETVAAMIAKVDTNRSDSYALTHMQDVHDNVFKGNYYFSLTSPLYIGSVAQHLLGGGNLIMYADTLHCPEAAGGNTSVEFPQYGTFRYSSTGSRLIDYTYLGYSNDEDIKWGNINTDCNGLGKDLRYDRIATIKVEDDQGNDLSGATVTIVNNYGQLVASGSTDSFGEFTDTVTYKARHYNSPYDDGSCYWEDSLLFNDFTIKAKYGGDSSITTLAINAETAFPFNMSLNGDVPANNPPSTPLLASPSNGASLEDLTPVLTINNSSDTDGDALTYSFQVSSNSSFTSIVAQTSGLSEGGGSTTSWTISPNLSDGNGYYWRVRAYDGEDYSGWSSSRTFSVNLPNNVPSTPVLASPSDGATLDNLTPVLTVNNSSDSDGDALTYSFQVSSNSSFTAIVAQTSDLSEGGGSTTSWTVSPDLSNGNSYYWRVRAYDGENYSAYSQTWAFNIDYTNPNDPPTPPVSEQPPAGDSVDSPNPILVVTNSVDADGDDLYYHFEVWHDLDQNFVKASLPLPEGSGSTTSWQVDTALEDGEYYWRARTYDGQDYADWTQWSNFYVETSQPNEPPSTPALADPDDGAVLTSTAPVLTTGNSTDPDGDDLRYSFQVALSSDFSSIEAQVSNLSEGSGDNTSWTVSPELLDGNAYYWRVRAYDGTDYSNWSDSRSFSIEVPNNSPSIPVLASPDDSSSVEILRPVLTLNNSNDPEGDVLVYDIQISTSQTFMIPLAAEYGVAEGSGETTSWTVPNDLSDGGRYFWRARAYDGESYSGWSDVWTFVVELPNNAPTTPVLASPANGSSVSTLTPVLVSNNSADADGDDLTYDFQVSSNSSFSSISAEVTGLSQGSESTTEWTVDSDLTDGNTYFWRVRATDSEDYSGWSQVRSFVIDLPNNVPTAPVLASPGNGGTVTSLSPELTVNNSSDDDNDALTYHFQVSSNSSFTAIVAQQSEISEGSGSTTSWIVNSSLNNQTNFWWRVRAYDGEDYSAYSQTSVFYVDYIEPNDPPEPPESDQPPAGDSVDSPNPILVVANSVDPDGDDLSYHFEVWNDQQSELLKASPPVPEESGSTTSWEVDTALEDGQEYHWRARSFDGSEYADWTQWSNFYVEMSPPNGPPSIPTIVLPNDGDTLIGSTHTLVIGNSNDPDGDEITYEFLICSDSGMSQPVENVVNVAEGTTNTTFITSATLEQGNTYCWHARACDGQDSSEWSETRSFVHFDFTAGVDDIPIPESPLEGEVVHNLRPTFRIQTNESDVGVDFYFEVSDNSEFVNPIYSGPVEGSRNKTSWRSDQNLVPNFTYYWRAKAEESGWCDPISFSTIGHVHVSPNPFRPDKDGEEIVFRNLPQKSDITITTVSGDIVYRMQAAEGPEIVWNGRNYNNQLVASGVYLYFVSSPDSSESGKIAVIR